MSVEKLILASFLDRNIWDRFGGLFKEGFFPAKTYQELFNYIKEYWDEVPETVTTLEPDVLSAFLSSHISNDPERLSSLHGLLGSISGIHPSLDAILPVIKESLYKSSVRNQLISGLEYLDSGSLDLDKMILNLSNITKASHQTEEELDLIEGLEQLIEEENSGSRYTTGLQSLDDKLQGGLRNGEIGVIIAPPFRGKTQTLVAIGAANLKRGTDVFHATCEISRTRTAIRYFQNILQKTRDYITHNPQGVRKAIEAKGLGKWTIKDYSATRPSTGLLRHDLMRFIDDGACNPLVIVDYADFVQPSRYFSHSDTRHSLRASVEELRQIGADLNIGVWTASQSNRSSYTSSDIKMGDVAEAVGKIEVADVVVVLNQTEEEKHLGNRGRFTIEKARERVIEDSTILMQAIPQFQDYKEFLA